MFVSNGLTTTFSCHKMRRNQYVNECLLGFMESSGEGG